MSGEKEVRPYGLWPSPITPRGMAQGTRLSDVAWDGDGETLVWLEGRSDRGVLVCAPANGGGDFTVAHGHAYFAEQGGRLYRQPLAAGRARPITPEFGHAASPVVSPD